MKYKRMPIEVESPEQLGYGTIRHNLAESSVSDAVLGKLNLDLSELLICYGDHVGKPALCEWIANDAGMKSREDVLVTAGAAAALFIVATALLENDSHLIVIRPNYATNIETPRAIGCEISFVELSFEEQFVLRASEIEKHIKPNTRLISITTPHNPTGTIIPEEEIKKIIALTEKHNCYLLVDETYRDLSFSAVKPLYASLSPKVISVSSVSKAYGLPGLRVGWICCSNKNLMTDFLAAKEQIFVCNSVVDEEIAYRFLLKRDEFLKDIRKRVDENFALLKSWIARTNELSWVEPSGGVVCFPKMDECIDTLKFYKKLYEEHQTMVGPGHWFEMDDHFMRIGFGWAEQSSFASGLAAISAVLKECK